MYTIIAKEEVEGYGDETSLQESTNTFDTVEEAVEHWTGKKSNIYGHKQDVYVAQLVKKVSAVYPEINFVETEVE